MGAQGTAILDFGTAGRTAQVDVTSQAVQSGTLIEAWLGGQSTAQNSVDEHGIEQIKVWWSAPDVAGSKFTIFAECVYGMVHGTFKPNWAWN